LHPRLVVILLAACGRVGFDASGGGDAGTDAPPPSGCANAGLVMCDGFESGMFADPPWSSAFNLTTDGGHVYRGTLAAHAHAPALAANPSYASTLIDNTNRSTFSAGTAYVRAFLYLTSSSSSDFILAQVGPTSNAPDQIAQLLVTSSALAIATDSGPSTTTLTVMPTDRWTCLELAVRGSTSTSANDAELIVWLDGALVVDVTSFDMSPSQQFVVGLNFYGGSARPASDMWMDEIALDSSRIGCAR
jgi:hypothetical protein